MDPIPLREVNMLQNVHAHFHDGVTAAESVGLSPNQFLREASFIIETSYPSSFPFLTFPNSFLPFLCYRRWNV